MSNPSTVNRRLVRAVGAALFLGSLAASSLTPATARAEQPSRGAQPVTSVVDGSRTGTTVLHRNANGVRAALRTGDLERRHAYTVWAVVFNNPDACDGPCDATDLADPDVGGVSTLLTGKVARGDRAVFAGRLRVGDTLTDPFGAEIHLVVRSHGPAIRGVVREQLTTLNGGCPPNACANVQMAIHGR